MGKWMTDNCTVVRYNDKLEKTLARCQEWKDRYQERQAVRHRHVDATRTFRSPAPWRDMILLAEAILRGALLRNESRGAHYKPDFPSATTPISSRRRSPCTTPQTDSAEMSYLPVDTSLVKPRPRTYGKTDATAEGKATTPAPTPVAV